MSGYAPERDKSGRFQPGSSGNPGGRVKLNAEQRAAWDEMRAFTPRFVKELILQSESGNPKLAPPAWKILAPRILPERFTENPFELPDEIADMQLPEQLAYMRDLAAKAAAMVKELEAEVEEAGGVQ